MSNQRIEFYDKRNLPAGSKAMGDRRIGTAVGDYLAVTYTHKPLKNYVPRNPTYTIFSKATGLPVIRSAFRSEKEAVSFAERLDREYGRYFPIWDRFPDANVFGWTQWTLPHGVRMNITLLLVSEQDIISLEDIKRAWDKSKEMESDWKRVCS